MCYFLSAVGSFAINYVPDDIWLFVAIYVQAAAWGCYLLVLGVATPLVGYESAGRLQGAMYSISTIGSLAGTYGSYLIFDATYDDDYADPLWMIIGGLTVVSCLISYAMLFMERVQRLETAS